MAAKALSRNELIMNFTAPPSGDDVSIIARSVLETLPDELAEIYEDLDIELQIEEFPDVVIEQEMNLETPYDLLALYRSGKEIAPGVQKKIANNDDVLVIFRRPVLDLWCETNDDLNILLREVIIEELARAAEFSEDDIKELLKQPFQGYL